MICSAVQLNSEKREPIQIGERIRKIKTNPCIYLSFLHSSSPYTVTQYIQQLACCRFILRYLFSYVGCFCCRCYSCCCCWFFLCFTLMFLLSADRMVSVDSKAHCWSISTVNYEVCFRSNHNWHRADDDLFVRCRLFSLHCLFQFHCGIFVFDKFRCMHVLCFYNVCALFDLLIHYMVLQAEKKNKFCALWQSYLFE